MHCGFEEVKTNVVKVSNHYPVWKMKHKYCTRVSYNALVEAMKLCAFVYSLVKD
jgi:hypothetical protein